MSLIAAALMPALAAPPVPPARSALVRDLTDYAMATCLAAQPSPFLKEQGEGWAEIVIARAHGSPEPFRVLAEVVRKEARVAPMLVNRDEAHPMGGKPMPVAFCGDLVDQLRSQAAIKQTHVALANAYQSRR